MLRNLKKSLFKINSDFFVEVNSESLNKHLDMYNTKATSVFIFNVLAQNNYLDSLSHSRRVNKTSIHALLLFIQGIAFRIQKGIIILERTF
jgi:hypothetical protein